MIPIFLLKLATLAATAESATLNLSGCDIGEVYSFANGACTAQVGNNTSKAQHITVKSTWPGDSVDGGEFTIPPNGVVQIRLNAAIGQQIGRITRYFEVVQPGQKSRKQYLKVDGFAMSALDDTAPHIAFGSVSVDTQPVKELALGSRDTANFRIREIIEKPAATDVEIGSAENVLRVRIKPDAPWGVLNSAVKVSIDTPHQKEAWISVTAEVHGAIAPAANPISLGIISANREQKFILTELREKDGKKFQVGSIRVDGIAGSAQVVPCMKISEGCTALQLTVSERQGPGMTRAKVIVDLPDYKKTLTVDVEGFLLAQQPAGKNQKDEKIADAPADTSKSLVSDGAKPPEHPVQIAVDAGRHAALPAPAGAGPLLKWSIGDERAVYGYQIFRADRESGPFVLATVPAIRAQSNDLAGSAYEWRDMSAEKGNTYWYYIGVVYNSGQKQQLTGPQKTVAK